jgi:RNA polymerase primary sigma factor
MPVAARCPSGNPGAAWSDVMANAASAEEQGAQQVEAPGKDSPLLDLSDTAVKEFIKTAMARGYATYDELNAVLPSEEVSSEQIEDTMSMLSDMGITVVESEDQEEGAAAPDGEDEADDDDAGGRAVATVTSVPAIRQARTEPAERSDDPVRMYLRDMGSVELLSREGEIAIAKRIEAGREAMIAGLCESPLTFQAIIIWRDELMNAKILLRDIIDLGATYEGPEAKVAPPVADLVPPPPAPRLSPPSVPRMTAKAALKASSTMRMSTRMRSRSPPWRLSSSRRCSRPSTTLPPRT